MVDAYVALEKINATLIPTSRLQRAYQYLQTCFSNRPSCWLPLAFSTSLKSHNCARGVVYLKQSLTLRTRHNFTQAQVRQRPWWCAGGKDPVIDGVKFELWQFVWCNSIVDAFHANIQQHAIAFPVNCTSIIRISCNVVYLMSWAIVNTLLTLSKDNMIDDKLLVRGRHVALII